MVRALRQLAARARRPQVQVAGPARQLLGPRGRRHGRRAGAARREVAEVGHAAGLLERVGASAWQVQLLLLLGVGVVGPLRGWRLVARRRPVGRLQLLLLVRPNLYGHTHTQPNSEQAHAHNKQIGGRALNPRYMTKFRCFTIKFDLF